MKEIIIVGDIHFGKKLNTEGFLDFQIEQFNRIIKYSIDNNIKDIIQLGDWFDNRTSIDFRLLDRLDKEILSKIPDDFTIHYIAGNHDIYHRNNNDINSVELLLGDYNVFHIVKDVPEEIKIGNNNILLVPWISDSNKEQCTKAIKETKCDTVCGHFEISGFAMSKTYICDKGLNQSSFKKFKNVFSGHFHIRNTIGNITYIGSMTQLDWGDYENSKAVVKLSDKVEEIKITDDLFFKVDLPDEIDNNIYENKILKIFINDKLDKVQSATMDKLIENSMYYEVIDNTVLLSDVKGIDVEKEDFEDIFAEYMKEQEDITEEDKLSISAIVSEIHKEARGLTC